MFANASYWIYPHLLKSGLRLWVYSGDVDADVPITLEHYHGFVDLKKKLDFLLSILGENGGFMESINMRIRLGVWFGDLEI